MSQGSPERLSDEDTPLQHIGWNQPFFIDAYVVQADDSTTAIDAAVNSLRADIEKAVMQDPYRQVSGTRYAVDTYIRDPQRFVTDNGAAEGITIQIDVHYRTLYTNPYTA